MQTFTCLFFAAQLALVLSRGPLGTSPQDGRSTISVEELTKKGSRSRLFQRESPNPNPNPNPDIFERSCRYGDDYKDF